MVYACVIQFNGSTFTCAVHLSHSFSSCCKIIAVRETAIGTQRGMPDCDFYVELYQIFSSGCDKNLSIMTMFRSDLGFPFRSRMI